MSTSFLISVIVILTVFVIYLYIVKAGLETAYKANATHYSDKS